MHTKEDDWKTIKVCEFNYVMSPFILICRHVSLHFSELVYFWLYIDLISLCLLLVYFGLITCALFNLLKVNLKSGLNVLTWTLYPGKRDENQGLKKPLLIRSIEITGIRTLHCLYSAALN